MSRCLGLEALPVLVAEESDDFATRLALYDACADVVDESYALLDD